MSKNGIVVAIHQPNYFPWLGFFYKIAASDVFIFLDKVAYPKSGNSMGCYTNRVHLLERERPIWLTCPVKRETGVQLIHNIKIRNLREHYSNLEIIYSIYKEHQYFQHFFPLLEEIYSFQSCNLFEFNINAINKISHLLGIKTLFMLQSDLPYKGSSSEMLLSLVQAVNGQTYLSGTGGSTSYLNSRLFEAHSVNLRFSKFSECKYPQRNSNVFLSGLSIIDTLMNCGKKMTREIINADK